MSTSISWVSVRLVTIECVGKHDDVESCCSRISSTNSQSLFCGCGMFFNSKPCHEGNWNIIGIWSQGAIAVHNALSSHPIWRISFHVHIGQKSDLAGLLSSIWTGWERHCQCHSQAVWEWIFNVETLVSFVNILAIVVRTVFHSRNIDLKTSNLMTQGVTLSNAIPDHLVKCVTFNMPILDLNVTTGLVSQCHDCHRDHLCQPLCLDHHLYQYHTTQHAVGGTTWTRAITTSLWKELGYPRYDSARLLHQCIPCPKEVHSRQHAETFLCQGKHL